MAAVDRGDRLVLHPLNAVLVAGALPLFLGALLADMAYNSTFEIQWKNFASWLLVGALVLCGVALLWVLIELLRADRRGGYRLFAFLALVATWILGFVNALVHAKDAWASTPAALLLSIIVAVLALASTWLTFSPRYAGDVR